ncbi:PQQ-dependent sugar dehydrogenase [Halostagnicola bangensis]
MNPPTERTNSEHARSTAQTRRTVLSALAASGAAAGLGTVVSAQEAEAEQIVLLGPTPGWIGVEPDEIEDEENPTLELEAGQTYEVTWENSDGLPHNFAILSADGEQLVRSEITEETGEVQTVEFEATEEMAEYYCEMHPDTMRGDLVIGDAQPEDEDPEPLEDIPVAGNFPEGERIGLQKVAEDLPGLTGMEYIEGDEENRNFIVTQTGQVYIHYEDEAAVDDDLDDEAEDDVEMDDEEDEYETDDDLEEDADEEPRDPDEDEEPVFEDDEDDEIDDETDPEVGTPDDMELFIDLSDRIVDLGILDLQDYDERGLLGLAFHPDFQENGQFYVRYSGELREGTPEDYDHTDVLAEFQVNDDGEADPDSERILMEIPQPQDNHNGGALEFGPEGYLYVAIGDGGNVHDIGLGHVEDWYPENEGGNGQDTQENLLGGILRIDVDAETEAEANGPDDGAYGIPDDNPLVELDDQLDEYYAWGFRNPWGMTIQDDGTIFVADAGQHLIESVYIVEYGGNYGWNVKEGSICFSPETPIDPPAECPDETPEDVRGGEPLRNPIAEYQHQRGTEAFIDSSVVVGGYRYDGEDIPELQGKYVFGNWSAEGVVAADGELLTVTPPGDEEPEEVEPFPERWDLEELVIENAENESLNRYVYNVMRDEAGELYVLTNSDYRPDAETGEIYRIVPEDEGEDVPAPEDAETVDEDAMPDEDETPEEADDETPEDEEMPDDEEVAEPDDDAEDDYEADDGNESDY